MGYPLWSDARLGRPIDDHAEIISVAPLEGYLMTPSSGVVESECLIYFFVLGLLCDSAAIGVVKIVPSANQRDKICLPAWEDCECFPFIVGHLTHSTHPPS